VNSARPRLCIVVPGHWKGLMGGAEYQVACLLDAIVALDRFDIYYLAHHVAPDFEPAGYRIVHIGRGIESPRWGYISHAVPLYRALRAIDPEVIYQRVGGGYTAISAFYARRHGACLIWHLAHEADVTPGASLAGRNPLRRFLEKRSMEYGLHRAEHIVAQTDRQAELLRRNYGRTAAAVIPNLHPEPRETIDKSGPLRVVWIANLKPWKQPEAFVRLAGALADLANVRFVMVGAAPGGSAQWNAAVMDTIRAAPNIDYLGPLAQHEVNELLARAHIFVNTSVLEGFPNTFIQAWMREVPVVSLHVNPDDVLNRQGTGFYAGDEQHLAAAVRTLLSEPEVRRKYAQRARAYALQRHSLKNAEQLVTLLDTCVNRKGER
jgi:glycosyltransferase involved in cell wall biosynthesis